MTATVPPNAQTVLLTLTVGFLANAGVTNLAMLQFAAGGNMYVQSVVAQVNGVQQYFPATLEMPVISQSINYLWSNTNGTRALYIDVFGYSVPNGAS
jgi:hypothetical protein